MADNLEQLTHTIPDIFELIRTIQEAAKHGASHPNAEEAMKNDVVIGITAVETAIQKINPDEAFEPVELKKLSRLHGNQILEFVNSWLSETAGPKLLKIYFNLLTNEAQYSEETAKAVSKWVQEKMLASVPTKRMALLEIGQRCAAWAPEYSWKLMNQVVSVMPPEEQKKRFPHWKKFVSQPGSYPQREFETCPICGGAGYPFHASLAARMSNYDPMFLPAKLWMKCKTCSNLYSRYFPADFLKLGVEPKDLQPTPKHMLIRQSDSTSLNTWCNILQKISIYTSGKSLLEVGVGQGFLIAVAQELGYDVAAVELIESDAQETADLLDLPVICGDFLNLKEECQFDIITMGDVLEHLQRPAEGLKKAHALLRNGGILWLSTPNYESSFTHMMKAFDPMWCEPYHITYFSRRGLIPILEKIGFELLEYQVSNRYNGSMEMILRKKCKRQT